MRPLLEDQEIREAFRNAKFVGICTSRIIVVLSERARSVRRSRRSAALANQLQRPQILVFSSHTPPPFTLSNKLTFLLTQQLPVFPQEPRFGLPASGIPGCSRRNAPSGVGYAVSPSNAATSPAYQATYNICTHRSVHSGSSVELNSCVSRNLPLQNSSSSMRVSLVKTLRLNVGKGKISRNG